MSLDRRSFGKLLIAGATGTIAGCGGGDGGGSGASKPELEGRALTLLTQASLHEVNLNPFSIVQRGVSVLEFLDQLVLPVVHPTGEYLTSGHTWTVDGTDVSVPCAVANYELAVPNAITYTFDDRLDYWSGEPLDARAYHLQDRIWYHLNRTFDTDAPFRGEVLGDHRYRWTFPEGRNRLELEHEAFPGRPPLPPSFTKSWRRRLEDASSKDEVDSIYKELNGTAITFETLAEEGYGTGAYAIESPDDIYNAELVAKARSGHPADTPVPNVRIRTIGTQGMNATLASGEIDLGSAIIAEEGGDLDRNALPEKIQQLGTFPSPQRGGMQLVFNWRSKHLRRLWTRRAIAAVTPFRKAIRNTWGRGWRPPAHHAGLLSRIEEATFGDDLLSKLYRYPIERDETTAGDWMERAGYTKRGDRWRDTNGEVLSLRVLVHASSPAQRTLGNTLRPALRGFGIDARIRSIGATDFERVLREGGYDLAFGFVPGGRSPVEQYTPSLTPSRRGFGGSPLSIAGNPLGTCGEASGPASRPSTVTLPTEPGSLAIEGVDYDDGGATYRHEGGVDVSVCGATDRLAAPDTDQAEIRDALEICARWYNYALPNVVFAQPRTGLFGNTKQFALPSRDSAATTATRAWTTDPEDYHVQAGTVR